MRALFLSLFLSLLPLPALACEPCGAMATLDASVKAADAIIIGKRTDKNTAAQPEFIDLEVEAVLKGAVQPGVTLRTQSWSGMCAYGIIAKPDEPGVFFLATAKDGEYTAISNGCAVTVLPYENGFITVDNSLAGENLPGSEVLSLKAFVKRYLPELEKKE